LRSAHYPTSGCFSHHTGKKVAVIGGGPAGLSAAWFLALKGHGVTVYEALPKAGGMMRYCIPRYRLPEDILDKEIADIEAIGVAINCGARADSAESLKKDGYDAIFLSPGAPGAMKMGIPGEDHPMVLEGIDMLRAVNLGKKVNINGHVGVVGGGNVAMDVARSSLRLGAKKVTVIYRRTRDEMPANPEVIEDAIHEGVEMLYLNNPKQVLEGGGRLKLEVVKMRLGEPDESGRRRPEAIPGSEYILELDCLVSAIGQETDVPAGFGVETSRNGRIIAEEESGKTSRDGVFSGGDVVTGPASVIKAIEGGRRGASSIDAYLGGDGNIEYVLVEPEDENKWIGRQLDYATRARAGIQMMAVDERIKGFSQVENSFTVDDARCEADRCLRCQLRCSIRKAPMPPVKL